jgi:DNA repair exonuclease SbcCD nuclease subunit
MKSVSIGVSSKDLPFGFDYYAGGHIHTHAVKSIENKVIVYPGCLFPNNFSELKREKSSMVFCSFDTSSRKCEIEREILDTFSKVHISVSVLKQTPIEVYNILLEAIENEEIKDKLILLELKGTLSGKISDIHIETILKLLYDKGAMFVLKNTHNLVTTTIESKLISELVSQDEIEKRLFEEYVGDSCSYSEIKELLDLSFTKQEGEKIYLYEERIKSVIQQYFKDKSFKS